MFVVDIVITFTFMNQSNNQISDAINAELLTRASLPHVNS